MTLQAILFDMDGTLCDNMPAVLQALRETFLRFTGTHYTDEQIYPMFGPSEEGVIGPRVDPAVYAEALDDYLGRYAALHVREPFEGMRELLPWLRSRGARVAVVTGKGRGTADISMRTLGLDGLIDHLEIGIPQRAEKCEAITRVLQMWNIPPSAAVYIGDTPYDMTAAREAGVTALAAGWMPDATVRPADADVYLPTIPALRSWLAERL